LRYGVNSCDEQRDIGKKPAHLAAEADLLRRILRNCDSELGRQTFDDGIQFFGAPHEDFGLRINLACKRDEIGLDALKG
jgi:hypothetical protein